MVERFGTRPRQFDRCGRPSHTQGFGGGRRGMPRYAEFGVNTFVGSPSSRAEAYTSSPTPQGYFAVLAWCVRETCSFQAWPPCVTTFGGVACAERETCLNRFDFEEGGAAVFELRLHVLQGVVDILRRGGGNMACHSQRQQPSCLNVSHIASSQCEQVHLSW